MSYIPCQYTFSFRYWEIEEIGELPPHIWKLHCNYIFAKFKESFIWMNQLFRKPMKDMPRVKNFDNRTWYDFEDILLLEPLIGSNFVGQIC